MPKTILRISNGMPTPNPTPSPIFAPVDRPDCDDGCAVDELCGVVEPDSLSAAVDLIHVSVPELVSS